MIVETITMTDVHKAITNSNYFSDMNELDTMARRINGIQKGQLVEYYMKRIELLSRSEMNRLHLNIQKANKAFLPYRTIHAIPWKIAKITSDLENGFPHTHGDIIFLPDKYVGSNLSENDVYQTLIHEKIHIYQRLYPLQTNFLLVNLLGYSISTLRYKHQLANTLRSNPDINQIIYKDEKKEEILPVYSAKQPSGLIQITDSRDHPFEIMAYHLTDIILDRIYKPDPIISHWMKKYL